MKAKNRGNYLIGLAVIGCSALLLGAMTYALGFTGGIAGGGRTLQVDFREATGIKLHAVVKYAGKNAGTVEAIRYLTMEERSASTNNNIRVNLKLAEDVPPLPEDLSVRVEAETLLGERYVALVPGSASAPLLREGTVIQGADVTSVDAVARSAQVAVENVNDLLTQLKADYPKLVPRVSELLAQGSSILGQGSNLLQNVDRTVLNANDAVSRVRSDYSDAIPTITALLAQAQTVATNAGIAVQKVNTLLERVDGVVANNEGDLAKTLDELRVVSQNLKVITTYAKALSATLAEKPSTLIWGRKKNELPAEEAILESDSPVPVPTAR